ncbi:MAG TPA: hypothetical protein VFE65_33580 [Pseudonocardia sp.]|nr:hypothetical protein [Pseudonocardia sp.]
MVSLSALSVSPQVIDVGIADGVMRLRAGAACRKESGTGRAALGLPPFGGA